MEPTRYREEGLRLKEARYALRMTQQELADAIGSSLATIKGYERGVRIPNRHYSSQLAKLGINLSYVLDGEGAVLVKPENQEAYSDVVDAMLLHDHAAEERREVRYNDVRNRLRHTTEVIRRISADLGYEAPAHWVALVQELMVCHGLSDEGARRVFETLKGDGIPLLELDHGK